MSSREHGPFRIDVHAIRAVAVVLVLVYHLDIGWVRGGFVGVDAFFVVSGFLITSQLDRELIARGAIDLPGFWARRARRLLPSALIVLVVTAVAAVALSPREDWPKLGGELAASTAYVENWALALSSTDYLAAGTPSTPFQHFWSLGVEEQFYLLWPLLLLAAWRLLRRRRRAAVAVVAVVTAASLLCSVVLTQLDPAPAYFWPHTRAWEFGVGALLALAGRSLPRRVAAPAAAVGWAGLVAVGLLLPESVPYPGILAALPVLATALIIAARAETGFVGRVTTRWPVRRLGTLSYPLYLWHWPVALLLPRAVDLPTPVRAVLTVLIAVALAWITHRLVERPVIRGPLTRLRPRVTFAAVAGAMVLVLAFPTAGWSALSAQRRDDATLAARLSSGDARCFGAAAIAPGSGCAINGEAALGFTPSTLGAAYDIDPTWDDCEAADTAARSCVVGVRGGTRVALIGDSHAHHWSSALELLARQREWELHLYVKGGCEFSHVDWSAVSKADRGRCATWNAQVDRSLAAEAPYRLVFTSSRADLRGTPLGPDPAGAALAGYQASWRPLIDRGATIIAIRDTPAAGSGVQGCLDANPGHPEACAIDTARAFAATDRLAASARATTGAVEVDLSSSFCADGSCPAVIGNVLVYRDSQHLTRTYADTLAPALGAAVDAAIAPER